MSANFLAEMDPFAWEPLAASRMHGLGGGQRPTDESYAFHTAHLVAPAGVATFSIRFVNLAATRGTLIIEILGGSLADRKQLRVRTLSLAELAGAGGEIIISVPNDRPETYAVAGYIYDDSDGRADSMTVQLVVARGDVASGQMRAGTMERVPRLAGVKMPSFLHPSSQTWSRPQLNEKAFLSAAAALGVEPRTKFWGAAFVYHALRYQLGPLDGLAGFGIGESLSELADSLRALGAEVHVGAELAYAPRSVHGNDFAWLFAGDHEASPPQLLQKSLHLAEQVRPGGVIVLVFPWEHSRMPLEPCAVPKRGDVEILALKLLGQGHGVAQLKFRAGDRPLAPGTRTPFALLFRRGA